MPARPLRVLTAAAAAGILTVAGTGCAWRVETPPLERRTPSPTVVLRDQAALREQAVFDAATAGSVEALLAPERLAALGGVYVATPSPSPTTSATATPPPSLDTAVSDAIDGALAGATNADEDDPSLAALLRSIALSHALVRGAEDVAGAAPTPRAMPEVGDDATGPWIPAAPTAVTADTLATLAVAHDRAAFAYEVCAARAKGAERERALARARVHEDRAAALVALTGVEDDRAALYDVPPSGTESRAARAATQAALETEMAQAYAALIDGAAVADVPWILNGAYDAWMQVASLRGFEAATLPALPGVTAAS